MTISKLRKKKRKAKRLERLKVEFVLEGGHVAWFQYTHELGRSLQDLRSGQYEYLRHPTTRWVP